MLETITTEIIIVLMQNPNISTFILIPLSMVGVCYSVGSIIIKATPSKKDDEFLEKISSKYRWFFKLAAKFSYFQPTKK